MVLGEAIRDVLTSSEPVKWAVQNCLGLTICLLFGLTQELTFAGSCQATVFYAASALCFSVDRSVGGRFFGAFLWIAVFLTGGALGFACTQLAWLARGEGVPLQGLSDASFDSATVPQISTWFYVILIVSHVVLSLLLTWTRATAVGLDAVLAVIAQIFLSMLVVEGIGSLPELGQYHFWTLNYGSTLKNGLVVLLAMVVNASVVYVRSSHDDVRKTLADCLVNTGRLLSTVSSDLHAIGRCRAHGHVGVRRTPTSNEIMSETLSAQMSLMLSGMEPAWPGVFCSRSDEIRRFALVISKLQVHLGSIKSVETIVHVLIDGFAKSPAPVQIRLFDCSSRVLATLGSVIGEMQGPLIHSVSWRPHSLMFWDGVMREISGCFEDIAPTLHVSAVRGLEKALEEAPLDPSISDVRGTGVSLLASLESVVDEVIGLEVVLARALGVEDVESYRLAPDLPARARWYESEAVSALVHDVSIASGVHVWKMQWKAFLDGVGRLKRSFVHSQAGTTNDAVKASQANRRVQLYLKVFVSYQLAVITVILIGWLRFSNTGDYKTNALQVADWFSRWNPEYFFLAVAICGQDTVDASIYKAILRVTLIACGGSIGYAATTNSALMGSGWFVYFIALLVNFVTALFATISFDYRYSLFLFSYTFNGVFVCSYTGVCCPETTSLQLYAGKTVSTALGVVYAAIISNLVWPSYVSEIVSEHESSLISSYTAAIVKCFEKGRAACSKNGVDNGAAVLWDDRFPHLGYRSPDHAELNRDLLAATASRMGIVSKMYSEVETRSLDRHLMFFVEITVLPLPASLRLIFADIGRLGTFVNTSVRVLRSSFLRGASGEFSAEFARRMFDPTDALMKAASDVSFALSTILVSKRIQEGDLAHLRAKLIVLQGERTSLCSAFKGLNLPRKFGKADLRLVAWYTTLLRAVKELAGMSSRMVELSDYQSKEHLFKLRVQLPSKTGRWA